jgi:hypothetical protein
MRPNLLLLQISERLQADLVVAATVLFLVFATCGFIVSALGQPGFDSTSEKPQPGVAARPWRFPVRAGIIAGLVCGLIVLAVSRF